MHAHRYGSGATVHDGDCRMIARLLLLSSVILASGCTGIRPARGPLCSEMTRFANAVEPGNEAHVELCVDWGPRCADSAEVASQPVLASWRCEDGGSAPAAKFCDYLLQNASAEFPGGNFGAALSCLGGYAPGKYIDHEWKRARVGTASMPGVEDGVDVDIDYASATKDGPAILRIEVKAKRPPFPDDVVRSRLERDDGRAIPSLSGMGACSALSASPMFSGTTFEASYPEGAWVICDATVSSQRVKATATVLRYLYHASMQRPMAARRIDVTLAKSAGEWRITAWEDHAIDYAP